MLKLHSYITIVKHITYDVTIYSIFRNYSYILLTYETRFTNASIGDVTCCDASATVLAWLGSTWIAGYLAGRSCQY